MSVITSGDVYWDPYDVDLCADPYPSYRGLRDKAPLYYNDRHDFYALSRFDDVEQGLIDPETYSSARGTLLELMKGRVAVPNGAIIFEDPPAHTIHRGLLGRVFTPKGMNALESQIRQLCAQCLDPFVGAGGFDFVSDLGSRVPMRVIGMLLGIPEGDQEAIRVEVDQRTRGDVGKPRKSYLFDDAEMFGDYIDWRAEHPSDDLMTKLLNSEFVDKTGTTRQLTRDEVLTYVSILAAAGNETTNRLIGWTGKVLADNPDQRRELVAEPSLIRNAIEEVLRFEPIGAYSGRSVTREVELYGQKVPAGSAMLLLLGAANRDERHFVEPDRFDIHREMGHHFTFGYGTHFCLGAPLARIEGRIVLEEVLKRFPEWEVDWDNAKPSQRFTSRGWDKLPVVTP